MCFSATASFVASGGLAAAGAAGFSRSTTPFQKQLATIPALFAVQQAGEGMTWLSFTHEVLIGYRPFFVYVFLIAGLSFWPVYFAVVLYRVERSARRKAVLGVLSALTGLLCAYILYSIIQSPGHAELYDHHIRYDISGYVISDAKFVVKLCYALGFTCVVTSSVKFMHILGLLSFAAYVFSMVAFRLVATSVWCFFAALISLLVLYVISYYNRHGLDY